MTVPSDKSVRPDEPFDEPLDEPFDKSAAIAEVLACAPGVPTVFTTGFASRVAAALDDRPNHFYMTGSMGLALSVGTGVAMGSGRTTVVVDGDGSLLMNPATLLAVGADPDLPIVHVVLDDGVYASTGGQPTPGRRADLGGLAAASGYRTVREATTRPALRAALCSALAADSAVFIRCPVQPDAAPPGGRVTPDLPGVAARFAGSVTGGSRFPAPPE
ncbi:thiamine pyrophosphate-dependent enzyme [Kitasatospora sp. NPDC004799]|uniref:thiamine pyrophosphate-dependent enzyme n=1 Tax=Kitasatospora sp. NPDC004799 TaxID=3154460 RepID=UPI0033BB9791